MLVSLFVFLSSTVSAVGDAPALKAVHRWALATPELRASYHWWPDRRSSSTAYRWHMAILWHQRWIATHRTAAVPAWFAGDLACIGLREEGGRNTSTGMYGFIYPPGDYTGGAGYSSWLAVPAATQQLVAYLLWQRYGWSPWSTAGACGL